MPTSLLRAGPLAADFVSGTNRPNFGIRNGHRVAEFPDSGTTETFFTFNMPTVFAQGDIEVILTWMGKVAVGGDCVWEVAFERHQPGVDDLDSDDFAAGISAVDTADTTPGVPTETRIAITSAQYDGITQGDQFRLAVRRLGDDSSDTMSGDAQLMTVVIEQSADPAGGGGGFFTDGAGTRAGIGKGSPAPTAAGTEAIAHGTSADADGDYSLGFFGDAKSDYSILFGKDGVAGDDSPSEIDCIGIGHNVSARGNRGMAFGYEAETDNYAYEALAVGVYAHAKKKRSIAVGPYTETDGYYNISIGYDIITTISNDNIGIGHDIYSRGNHNIHIGHLVGTYPGSALVENIGIGYKVYSYEGPSIAIGKRLNVGDQEIILGWLSCIGTNQDPTYNFGNICLKTDSDQYCGLDNSGSPTPGTLSGNIILATGDRGGCRTWNGNSQVFNFVVSQKNTYIYGQGYHEIAIGDGIELGQYNNQTDYHHHNVAIGKYIQMGWYVGGDTYYNVALGNDIVIGTGVTGSVILGGENGLYPLGYSYIYNNIILGYENYMGNGQINIIIGSSNKIKPYSTHVSPYYFFANTALGYKCYITPSSDRRITAALAQGVGAEAWISGHRAFSDGTEIGHNAKPNQGGFIVCKVETVNNTPTTLMSFPTLEDRAYLAFGWVVARRTDSNGENAAFSSSTQLVYRDAAGAATLIGDPVSWTMDKNQGSPSWTITFTISGTNLLAQVTGETSKTIEWLGWIQVLELRG